MPKYMPERGSIYSLKVDTKDNPNNNHYYLHYYENTQSIHGSGGYKDITEYQWQLMPIGGKSFILCNQYSGLVMTIVTDGDIQKVTVGAVSDQTPLINGISVDGKVAMYVPAYDAYIVSEGNGEHDFLRLDTFDRVEDAAVFTIEMLANYHVPALPDSVPLNKPAFNDEGLAPAFTALSMGKSCYVPYCLVKDKNLGSLSLAIQESPYYLMQQYLQYHQAVCIDNPMGGEHTFVEHWQFGTSESKSKSFTQQFGMALNFSIEENEFFLKEDESVNASGELGFEESNTTSFSATGSKEIRVQVPANSSTALYGISSSYKLYQMASINEVCAGAPVASVAEIDNYSRMASNFLVISTPIS